MSQLRQPGQFSLPGAMTPATLAMDEAGVTNVSRETWCARVLAGFCHAALRFCTTLGGLDVNYNQLPEAVWTTLAAHWTISFSPHEVARLRAAASFDAKRPTLQFQPDADQKQREATHGI